MESKVRPNQNTVTQKEVMMKLHFSVKSICSDDINNSQFQRETDTVKVIKMSTDVHNLMSRSSLISSRNPLNQLEPRVLFSKKTLVPRRSGSQTLNFVIKRVIKAQITTVKRL